jgi:hypothetical protein
MDDIKKLMLKSLSDDLSSEEEIVLKNAISNSKELEKELNDHRRIKDSLLEIDTDFNAGFSDRVMMGVNKESIDLMGSFKSIAFSSVAAIALLLISIYFMDGSINIDSIFGLHGFSVEEEFYSFLDI